ncbi:hypothetical protein V9T40_011326 [Parthenolecanium corni]|uniref:Uncharacterized protein n=1 Tax=Parthenolecanium corni TaxID=536013 RepID=A0AAN9XZG0_9HEMI
MTMLSPSNNVKFTTMNPPVEFWKSMENMQRNWLESGVFQMPNFTELTPPPPPHFPAEYPEPGAVASEFTYGNDLV